MDQDDWVVACDGQEPIMRIGGKRYQYMWNRNDRNALTAHAYYCFEEDRFVSHSEWEQLIG
jgi:hypothetical protein